MRLDELGQTFLICLVIRLKCKDGTRHIIRLDKLSSVVHLNDKQQKTVHLDG